MRLMQPRGQIAEQYAHVLTRLVHSFFKHTSKSVLLLGPRQTGKSTLIQSLAPEMEINLASEDIFLQFSRNPRALEELLEAENPRTIFIDEIQRLPSLMNTLQVLIDEGRGKRKFYLTGSSARKLRRGHANLLPGRILKFDLGPLTFDEIPNFDLQRALAEGTLPGIYTELSRGIRRAMLTSYAGTYLKEEIQAEALTKNIEGFSRFFFLEVSADRIGGLFEHLFFTQLRHGASAHAIELRISTFQTQAARKWISSSREAPIDGLLN